MRRLKTTVNRDWSQDEVMEMHGRYISGEATLRSLGEEKGVTYERIRQVFQHFDLPTTKVLNQTRDRIRREQEAQDRREEIVEAFKRYGNLEDTARHVGLPLVHVRPIIADMPDAGLYQNKAYGPLYEEEYLLDCLRTAAQYCDGPLTIPGYNNVARRLGLPAPLTVRRWLNVDNWYEACQKAGVEANEPRGRRATSITSEECIESVVEWLQTNPERRKYDSYDAWARDNEKPSGSTVRVRVGGWRAALRDALYRTGY